MGIESSLLENKAQYIHCAGGYRSVIAISILKAKGFHQLINIEGGFSEIKNETNIQISEWVCPSEMI